MTRVYLGLGSNLGDRLHFLRQAVHALAASEGIVVKALSSVYETPPWGVEQQPAFLNMAVALKCELEPRELLQTIKDIEQQLGREETFRWGPRQIDIDILFYGDEVVDVAGEAQQSLRIPHASLAERAFVLRPLHELAPSQMDPSSGQTVAGMLAALGDVEGIRRLPLPLEWGWRTHVMGILNVTPDSFSGDGLLAGRRGTEWQERLAAQAQQFVEDGADILDVGGESTRPGSQPVTVEEELSRVIPAIEALRPAVDVPLSVDTYRGAVAAAALEAGADWINDVWGLRMDPELAGVVATAGCPVVLMHNRSRPKNVEQQERLGGHYTGIHYADLIGDVRRELEQSIDLALDAGIAREHIIVDPGIGFGKTISQNLQLIDELDRLRSLGYPLLLGPSRKSFIGYTLDLPPDDRVEGTAATVAIGIDRGADIVRVHDVNVMARVARMVDSIVRRK